MKNVETSVTDDVLTIKINLKAEGEKSASGKSIVLASTKGNKPVVGHPDLMLGINLYKSAK